MRLMLFVMLAANGVLSAAPVQAEMKFDAHPPQIYQKIQGDIGWTIFASGEIDADAGKRLEQLLLENDVPKRSRLYISSHGGSLIGGISLGKVFRQYELVTTVGTLQGPELYDIASAACLSACVPAFIGGSFRYWNKGSVIGVHRFFWEQEELGNADLAQIISAALVEHIRSMNVDTELFTISSSAGKGEFVELDETTALRLNVVNNGQEKPIWSIESIDQALYLKGEEVTRNGTNKIALVCAVGMPLLLYGVIEAGPNIDAAMAMDALSLFVGDETIHAEPGLVDKKQVGSQVHLFYRLNPGLIAKIRRANTLGLALQFAYDAPTFIGFYGMSTEGGLSKMPGFLGNCSR